jgi:myosin heavy subunit
MLRAHSEEDKEMISVLRSRVATLSAELEELERTAQSSPRISSADVALRMLDMELRSPITSSSAAAGKPVQVEELVPPTQDDMEQRQTNNERQSVAEAGAATEADAAAASAAASAAAAAAALAAAAATAAREKELHDRLLAKLQSQTAILMNTQTNLNSAENQLQMYKRQVADWLKSQRPEFSVKGNVDEEGGFVLYELNMLHEDTCCHTANMRYSAIAAFRSQLKRMLFVADEEAQSVRLPALPPKVWGNARSRSALVVKQREEGLRTFLNVMLALAELSEIVSTEFFKWLGWTPEAPPGAVAVAVAESKHRLKQ